MLRKRLVVINTLIISIVIGILILNSIDTLKRLFYHESTLIYEAQLNERYKSINDLFSAARNFTLEVCVNEELQKQLTAHRRDNSWTTEASSNLNKIVRNIDTEYGYYIPEIYPVNERGEVLKYSFSDRRYLPVGKTVFDYDIDREFIWAFRPEDKNCILVTRKIFSSKDGDTVLGIVEAEINISPLNEIFTGAYRSDNGTFTNLFLMDQDENVLLPYHVFEFEMDKVQLDNIEHASYELKDERITVVKRFPANRWMLVGQIEGVTLLAGSYAAIEKTVIWGISLIVIAFILTMITTKILTDPILKLATHMQSTDVAKNYEQVTIENPKGEIKILYDSYNNMISIINESISKIQIAGERDRENEFLLLQSQINPHFLYNTLDAIGWKAVQHEAYEIQEMVLYLVGMFRNSINQRDSLTQVRHEIEQVRCYLNIMQMRYPGAYVIEFEVEEGIEDYMIVRQLLQPLAENALQHGLYDSDNRGTVSIKAYRNNQNLVFKVANDGKLVDIEKVYSILKDGKDSNSRHYGIRNVNERLKNYYGDEHYLRFSIENGQTVATITIPISKTHMSDLGGR